jgi:hypothetical protein
MSNAYRILKSGLIVEVFVGRITEEELFEHQRRLLADPKFPPAPHVFVDLTRASLEASIEDKVLQQFVDGYRPHRNKTEGARVAIVAGKDFEKASLYGRLADREKINVIVFTTINTACVWLGVNEPEIRKEIKRIQSELLGESPPDV